MNAVKDKVRELVEVELAAANEKFPQFHSAHEGWAVLQEEIEECGDELSAIFVIQKSMWDAIRKEDREPNPYIKKMYACASNLACEAIRWLRCVRSF